MTLHETKSSPIKQAASPDSTGWLSAKRKRALIPWLFLAPALIIFSWFKFIPMIQGLVMSFYKVNFNQPNEWVGLDNFTRAFADAELHAAVVNTLLYVVVTMFAAAILAFFLAMLLEGPARHLRFIRTAIFYPRSPARQSSPKCGAFCSTRRPMEWLTTSSAGLASPIRASLPAPIRRWGSSCCCISGKRCPTTW